MRNRVVVTGIGVVAPNGIGKADFTSALKKGRSGIRYFPELQELDFRCHIGGRPTLSHAHLSNYLSELELKIIQADGIRYGLIAGLEAWYDAGLYDADYNPNAGCIMGSGLAGADIIREAVHLVDSGKVKRLGSSMIQQAMAGGISAYLGGKLKLGNQVTTNASACSSGTESLIMGYRHIRNGLADIMICGACDSASKYVWAGFDAMRALNSKYNDKPEKASMPMNANACGFVPGGGGGALVLESLEHAQKRNAKIYAEIAGGTINAGGQHNGGTMTAPNREAIVDCIQACAKNISDPEQLTAISGHLTSTMADPIEIQAWSKALGVSADKFPFIQSLKGMIGHCLSASGAIEAVACCIQIRDNFLHPCLNANPIHPEILSLVSESKIPTKYVQKPINMMMSASFGFGDVNSCLLLKKYEYAL